MQAAFNRDNLKFFKKIISSFIVLTFLTSLIVAPAGAQVLPSLNTPSSLNAAFQPPVLLGIKIHPENPLLFDFIVDQGQSKLSTDELKSETTKLVKYFLAALTIPDKEVWVNLSPTEKDRIIPDVLGQTTMGKTMLEQDYVLKQLAASLTNPETDLGKKYWDQVNGSTNHQRLITNPQPLATNNFNKVWIMPAKAEVLESNGIVLVGEKRLKVMLAEDRSLDGQRSVEIDAGAPSTADTTLDAGRLTLEKNSTTSVQPQATNPQPRTPNHQPPTSNVSSTIFRTTILPTIEKAVNEGKDFADVRQIYNSVILAAWYKKTLKESLLGKIYTDKGKVAGVETDDKAMKQRIYEQYLAAFKKGAYNLIKEEADENGDLIPRKYFSGGEVLDASSVIKVQNGPNAEAKIEGTLTGSSHLISATTQVAVTSDEAKVVSTSAASSVLTDAELAAKVDEWYEKFFSPGGTQITFTETPLEILQGIARNLENLGNELYQKKTPIPYKRSLRIKNEIRRNKALFVEVLAIIQAEIYMFNWKEMEIFLSGTREFIVSINQLQKLRGGKFNDVSIKIFLDVTKGLTNFLQKRDRIQHPDKHNSEGFERRQMVHSRIALQISSRNWRTVTQAQRDSYRGFYADFAKKIVAALQGMERGALSEVLTQSRVRYAKLLSTKNFTDGANDKVILFYGWELANLAKALNVSENYLWDQSDLRILNFSAASSVVQTILVVEDTPDLRRQAKHFLERNDHHVVAVDSVDAAKRILADKTNNVVFVATDGNMPIKEDIDERGYEGPVDDAGAQLIKYIQENYPNLPVVLMTADPYNTTTTIPDFPKNRVLNKANISEHYLQGMLKIIREVLVSSPTVASAPIVEGDFVKGGIDFDPTNMNLQIKRDGKGVPLPLPQQNLEQINIQGLFPVIINITPINAETLPIFLGQAPKEPAREPELTASFAG